MKEEDTYKKFHHALKVVHDLCIGCTHCMKACPTEAIRVREGKAVIIDERCVDCGNCCKACPVSAIVIEQDDFEQIYTYPVRIALIPSVLIGQFPSHISTGQIFGALKKLGFTHIYEIDSLVDLVQEGYRRYAAQYRAEYPLISTFCPAVVRLIQVRFPAFVDQLMRVKPPSDVAALYYRKKMEQSGTDPREIGVFYVTPCAAKVASIKSPVGEEESPVNGVINMEYLYNRLYKIISDGEAEEAEPSDPGKLTSKGVLWSLTRGESDHQEGRSLAVDGMNNVTEFLERLEESEQSNLDFLELRACDQSCAGGVLISGNRFLTVERLSRRAATMVESQKDPIDPSEFNEKLYALGPIAPRSMMALDDDPGRAMRKMNKVEDLLKILPGIDCSACGSPTCRTLAEDIVKEKAELTSCVFIQELYIRDGRMSAEEADRINTNIWGGDRDYRSQMK